MQHSCVVEEHQSSSVLNRSIPQYSAGSWPWRTVCSVSPLLSTKLIAVFLFFSHRQEWGGRGCRAEHTGCGAPSILVVSQLQPATDYVFRLHSANIEGQFGDPGPEVIFCTKGEQYRRTNALLLSALFFKIFIGCLSTLILRVGLHLLVRTAVPLMYVCMSSWDAAGSHI